MHSTKLLWRVITAIASVALLVAPVCAAKTHPQSRAKVRTKTVAKASRNVYIVRKGDALVRIARRLHVNARELARVNDLKDPDRIREGQVLRLPGSRANRKQVSAGGQHNDKLVRTALQYRGVPYRYAGMSSRGMDCSGLVARVLKTHGIKAPHNAASLYRLGLPVPYGKLLAGDLVFFHTTRRGISHVGVYVGEGKFVHASSGGGRVQVDRMDQGYYRQRFVGARRIK
jgi:cell wall-associated NlpC family hydrolase